MPKLYKTRSIGQVIGLPFQQAKNICNFDTIWRRYGQFSIEVYFSCEFIIIFF